MTTLVTGATGFVGSAVLRKLVEAGHDVRVLARAASVRDNLDGIACEIVTGDLTDAASLRAAVAGCDTVFHVAADYRLWVPDPAVIDRVNIQGSVDLFRAAAEAGATRMVYTSSVATLGLHKDGTPADEATPSTLADMVGAYKRSKFKAEEAVKALIREEKLPIVIVNPSTPIGPRDIKPTPTGKMIRDAAAGKMPGYVETGLNVAHVDDVAEGHLLALEKGVVGERYILGGENMMLQEIFQVVCQHVGRQPPRFKLPRAPLLPLAYCAEVIARITGRDPRFCIDEIRMAKKIMFFSYEKARRELGYRPRPAVEAIRDAVDWFQAHGYLG